jgi:surface polysaccharide O-acyltransferase-like enzyme
MFNLAGFPVTIFLNQIARFAVPLFFVISGFVLEISFTSNLGYLSFIKKRFSRIFIPFVFWSAIYYLFIYKNNHDNILRVILTGDASYQLYFIPTLCIFYLVFPLLHKIYKYISNIWVLILLSASQIWFLRYDYFIKPFRFVDPIHIALLAYFFFIIGIVAARNRGKIYSFVQKWKYIIFPGIILSGIYVFWEGWSRYFITGNYLSYYSQWRPSVWVYTILIGMAFFYFFEKMSKFILFVNLSKFSFLVFFIHVAVLESFWSVIGKNLYNLMSPNIFGKSFFDLIFFTAVAGISFLLASMLHKIPKLNKLIG